MHCFATKTGAVGRDPLSAQNVKATQKWVALSFGRTLLRVKLPKGSAFFGHQLGVGALLRNLAFFKDYDIYGSSFSNTVLSCGRSFFAVRNTIV